VLIPAVGEALKAHEKIRLLYQIEPDFQGYEPGAMWDDFVLGIEHVARWDEIAVVTDVDWIRHAVQAFRFLMPGRVRVFSRTEAADARAWISAET
jgi:hypothetical protein